MTTAEIGRLTLEYRRMRGLTLPIGLAAALTLSACVVAPPTSPTVMALPAQGKSWDQFQREDVTCRQYGYQQAGGEAAADAATTNAVGGAVLGTALGAGVGAALGSLGGAAGAGAAVGGAVGLAAGSSAGANSAAYASGNAQQRFDTGYTQCMYSYGNTVQGAPSGYAAYPGAYPGGYPVPYPAAPGYYYGPGYYGPSVTFGIGGGHRGYRRW
jgi:hypothetical protein